MGVFGLSTFISNNDYAKRHSLQDCCIVADGPNLLHAVFQDISFVDYEHSGNYARISDAFSKFFERFKQAKLQLVILMDGYAEPNSSKAPTTLRRQDERVKFVKDKKKPSQGILPIFSWKLFIKIAQESGALVVQCIDEADERMMTLANILKCPVLSKDGDFYIYNLECGFVPLDSVDFSGHGAIRCTLYRTRYLLDDFPKLQLDTLPLLAVLAGNDYSAPVAWTSFQHHIPSSDHDLLEQSHNKHRNAILLIRLLTYLNGKSFQAAADGILDTVATEQRDNLRKTLEASRVMYGYGPMPEKFHKIKKNPPVSVAETVKAFADVLVLQYASKYGFDYLLSEIVHVHSPFLGHCLMQVAICRQVYLDVLVEDYALSSVFDVSVRVQHALYALVTHGCDATQIDVFRAQRNSPNDVVYAPRKVDILKIHRISMEDVANSDAQEKQRLFEEILSAIFEKSVPKTVFEDLFLASLYIWSQAPYAFQCHVAAVIMSNILTIEEIRFVLASLDIDSGDVSIKSRVRCVHSLNAWQFTYNNLLCLNAIFGNPRKFPDPSFFNGRLCFSLCAALKFSNDMHASWQKLSRRLGHVLTEKRLDEVLTEAGKSLAELGLVSPKDTIVKSIVEKKNHKPKSDERKKVSSEGASGAAASSAGPVKKSRKPARLLGSNKFAALMDDD